MSKHRNCTWIGWCLIVALGSISGFAQPSLLVLEPSPETYLVDTVVFRATVDPAEVQIRQIDFFVDGTLACRAEVPPFQCSWDAGRDLKPRLVRVVATPVTGERVITTFLTRGLDLTESVDVKVVLVPVVVTDWRGRFVRDLRRKDFRIFENEVAQEITSFQAENAPLEIVVAVDISASMSDSMTELKRAVKQFVTSFRSNDVVTLLAFNDRTYKLVERESDPARIFSLIDRLPAAFGGTALRDAILDSLKLLSREIRRRAVMVFTDGDDRSSLATLEPLEQQIKASDAGLYFISQGRANETRVLRDSMAHLAQLSGGRVFSTPGIDELQEALAFVREDLANQYLLGYTPAGSDTGTSYRRIRVELSNRRHHVRARTGYDPLLSAR